MSGEEEMELPPQKRYTRPLAEPPALDRGAPTAKSGFPSLLTSPTRATVKPNFSPPAPRHTCHRPWLLSGWLR